MMSGQTGGSIIGVTYEGEPGCTYIEDPKLTWNNGGNDAMVVVVIIIPFLVVLVVIFLGSRFFHFRRHWRKRERLGPPRNRG